MTETEATSSRILTTTLSAYCQHCDNLPLSGISHIWSACRRFIFLITMSLAVSRFTASLAKSPHTSLRHPDIERDGVPDHGGLAMKS